MKFKQSINKYRGDSETNISLKDFASEIWPDASPEQARLRLSRATNEKIKYIEIDFIRRFCEKCNVSPSYLFNYRNGKFNDK